MHDDIRLFIVGEQPQQQQGHWDSTLLLFGMIGLAMGAVQWTVSPWFITLPTGTALVGYGWYLQFWGWC